MAKKLLTAIAVVTALNVSAQTNILSTNPIAEQIMQGNYDPANYAASTVINDPVVISSGIHADVSPDSLHAYLDILRTFKNRNTGSDTSSATTGIGAARKWVYSKFQQFGAQNENRLIPSYLQFDYNICNMLQHKNILAVLPGTDTSDKSIIIVEAHIDSRCAGLCDTACTAEGMEDNGSGTALVLELARVMSKYSFNHTIVFTPVIGEEQGLMGAEAFADYCQQKGIKVKAVLNNDVVGGIICGQTASPPGCPGLNSIDSTQVKFFSAGSYNSPHKQLSRYIKLQYKEMIQPTAAVPMLISIMTNEDRIGRGGDHIPFRQHSYPAMRITSANEHGDASNSAGYADRQHTSDDILGVDTNGDSVMDSFFVDFNYLARNTVINGNAMAMAAISPKTPNFWVRSNGNNDITVDITDPYQYLHYRVGVRSTTNDWDSVYIVTGSTVHSISIPHGTYIVSVASVDNKNVESLFSYELMLTTGINEVTSPAQPIELLQNKPNPADETTMISVLVNNAISFKKAYISVADIVGKEISRMDIALKTGVNEVLYEHGFNMSGTFVYTLVIDGKPIQSRRMTFTN